MPLKTGIADSIGVVGALVRRAFESVISLMNSIGTVWIFVLLVIINVDVGGRVFFNSPLRGANEIVSMSIVAIVFLQIAHTLKSGRLTRSDLLLNIFERRIPRVRQFLEGIFHLVGACLLAIIFNASLPLYTLSRRIGEYVGAQGDFMAPTWPVKLVILIGCTAACLQFLVLAAGNFRRAFRSNADREGDGS